MTRLPVPRERLTWVRERAGLDALALAGQRRSGATTPRGAPRE